MGKKMYTLFFLPLTKQSELALFAHSLLFRINCISLMNLVYLCGIPINDYEMPFFPFLKLFRKMGSEKAIKMFLEFDFREGLFYEKLANSQICLTPSEACICINCNYEPRPKIKNLHLTCLFSTSNAFQNGMS